MIQIAALLFAVATAVQPAGVSGKVKGANGPSVVYVEAISGKRFTAPEQHPVVDQKSMTFIPHILVTQQGATVDFLNNDRVAHNIFWRSIGGNRKLGKNLGTWPSDALASPRGNRRSFRFDTAGIVPLLCNVHPEMSAYIVVAPTPYYTQTEADGSFTISGIPDGEYQLTAWHEGLKTQTVPVTVKGGLGTADFMLSK